MSVKLSQECRFLSSCSDIRNRVKQLAENRIVITEINAHLMLSIAFCINQVPELLNNSNMDTIVSSTFQMGKRSTERHGQQFMESRLQYLWSKFRDKSSSFSAIWAAIHLHCPVMRKNNIETLVPNSKIPNGEPSLRPRP